MAYSLLRYLSLYQSVRHFHSSSLAASIVTSLHSQDVFEGFLNGLQQYPSIQDSIRLSLNLCLSVMYRGSCPFWRSSSVRRSRQSSPCWWTFFTARSCCFQRLLGYAVRAERSCPSESMFTTSIWTNKYSFPF